MSTRSSKELIAELSKYVITEPWPFVVDLENCAGMWLSTVEGRRIFDWAGYYGAKLIGHNHPRLSEPDYLKKLILAANNKVANPDFLTEPCLDYYRLLYELAPSCMRNEKLEVYAVNSGAEAIENMMKYLINLHHHKHQHSSVRRERHRFIYFDQAFHGRTIFALNVTQMSHDPVITKDFQGLVPGNIKVPFPFVNHSEPDERNTGRMHDSLEIIEKQLQKYDDEIVGIIVEPLQGAGGHRIARMEFFRELSRLAHQYNVYLGFDEVQTAGGQTGTFWAVDQMNLPHPPQAIASAKKLGNGVVYMLHPMIDHGVLDSTWGGSLADMVRFVQEIKIIRDEKLMLHVGDKSKHLVDGLLKLQARFPRHIYNVRGMGLYQGFSFHEVTARNRFQDLALETQDLLLLTAGTHSIRLRPALDVTMAEIDLLLEKCDRALAGV